MVTQTTYWRQIYSIFIRHGFTPREAEWAADNDLDPLRAPERKRRKQIVALLKRRLAIVDTYLKLFKYKVSKAAVALDLEEKRRYSAEKYGEDPDTIFIGETP